MIVSADLRSTFGEIDIYLFDQLLRGRFDDRSRVLDAGCGDGRNVHYLLKAGIECFGIDADAGAIDAVRRRAADLAPAIPLAISSPAHRTPAVGRQRHGAVLQRGPAFSDDEVHFGRMVTEMCA